MTAEMGLMISLSGELPVPHSLAGINRLLAPQAPAQVPASSQQIAIAGYIYPTGQCVGPASC